ncbi:EAL domain-containing protein [Pseudoalteromonas sp. S16_S37]|uniref:EAL domain-containing protein n=1 Tax=Pseudoalteromonas sp. S16_S37 TaxID=2720228 RepID=UPI001681827B|nr:GGDEF domain-containing protein [Pseudoalteromonas sp. S16_S37]
MLAQSSTWFTSFLSTFTESTAHSVSLFDALVMGGVATAGIMLCIVTKEVLLKGLHAALCIITFLLLLLNIPMAMFMLAIVFAIYHAYSFSFSASWLSKLVAGSICIYAIFLSGYLLSQWPISFAALGLFPIYFGLLYATRLDTQVKSQADLPKNKLFGNELGVPYRACLRQAYEEQRRLDPGPAILVVVFLEGIEQVNTHLGREFGDTLLAESANRIQQQLNNRDIFPIPNGNSVSRLAHLGGLHFAFVCRLGRFEYLHEQLIDDILLCIAKPFHVGSCTLEISARASYVNCDEELGQFDSLISCGYLALDKLPKQSICAYQQQMQISQVEQQVRLRELANIKISEELEIFFQPAFSQQGGKIAYLELLLRWPHPKLGLLNAESFIEDIRLAGLALPVARFVIERAAELAMALKMEGLQVPLNINIFGQEMLQQDFLSFMDHILLEHYLQAGEILLEFPAQVFLNIDQQTLSRIEQLRQLGVHIGIDRFGQTPIQLNQLSELQVDFIKLSAELTAQPQPEGALAIFKNLVAMQQQRGVTVICEGIESKAQLEFAKLLKCDAVQGHYLAQPMSSKGVMGWLHKWQSKDND